MTWDPRLYFPFEGRRAEDFFALKNPDGFGRVWTRELEYLKQHATPRPPKPLKVVLLGIESVAIIVFTETATSAIEKGIGSKFNQRYPQCEECGHVAGVH